MKKTYSTPALKVVSVKTQHLMAGSGIQQDGAGNLFQDLSGAGETDATSGNLSKDNSSMWDED